MPLPSSFLLFASSSFLSLAFNASSAFAEIKNNKISALILCLYHKWKYWGKGKEIPYIFCEVVRRKKQAGWKSEIYHLQYLFRILEYLFQNFEA